MFGGVLNTSISYSYDSTFAVWAVIMKSLNFEIN